MTTKPTKPQTQFLLDCVHRSNVAFNAVCSLSFISRKDSMLFVSTWSAGLSSQFQRSIFLITAGYPTGGRF